MKIDPDTIVDKIRDAGIAGAGGAGFPSYGKWGPTRLLVNHQESEPGYFVDKWLGKAHAEELAELFDALLDAGVFELIVIGAKEKDREWSRELEKHTDAEVFLKGDLPIDPDEQEGIVFTYTMDNYSFGKEKALLAMATGENVGEDLPQDHNWIVHNTETLYNLYRALEDDAPVTRKFVHVYGEVPDHKFLEVPMGTPFEDLLQAAGSSLDEIQADDLVLADGGPGWCFEVEDPEGAGVRKRTNAILVLDREVVDDVRTGGIGSRIDVLHKGPYDWSEGDFETEPAPLTPDLVRVPLISNPGFAGLVAPSDPVVKEDQAVEEDQQIATIDPDGAFSEIQHASISGTVTRVVEGEEDGFVEIES